MKVFVSYTRGKDKFNAVTDFVAHFQQGLQMIRRGSTVFQDKVNIVEGDVLPEVIERALKDSDLLLPLISAAWFDSNWCPKEFKIFWDAHQPAPLIMPVLWVTAERLNNHDEVAAALAQRQMADFHILRHRAWDNPELRQKVAELAESATALVSPGDRQHATRINLRL